MRGGPRTGPNVGGQRPNSGRPTLPRVALPEVQRRILAMLPPGDIADGAPVMDALSRLAARIGFTSAESIRGVYRGNASRSEATISEWERRHSEYVKDIC